MIAFVTFCGFENEIDLDLEKFEAGNDGEGWLECAILEVEV